MNTPAQTGRLQKNKNHKLAQCAEQYGMIVIDYGGNDEAIFHALSELLELKSSFPNGLYWYLHKSSKIPNLVKRLEKLDTYSRLHFVEIAGSDELLTSVHKHLVLQR